MDEKLSKCSELLLRLEETKKGKNISAKTPKISIIIPAYNIAEYISGTLDSVFSQTYKDFEVIILNDGSPDTKPLESVLENYADEIIYGRQKNCGTSMARNAAICLSRGELIAFLDGDDLWQPAYLEKQVNFLDKNALDMVYCDAEFIGDNYFEGKTYMETTPSNGEVNPISLLNATCNVITSGTVLKKEKLAEVNLFDTECLRAQDFELWFRLSKNGTKIGYQKECLVKYRISSKSLSGTNINRSERTVAILEYIRNKHNLTPEETKVWKHQFEFSKAAVELEKAKLNLIKGNHIEAKEQFKKANLYYQTPKLFLLGLLLSVSPKLALKIFKKFRPREFSFISEGKI